MGGARCALGSIETSGRTLTLLPPTREERLSQVQIPDWGALLKTKRFRSQQRQSPPFREFNAGEGRGDEVSEDLVLPSRSDQAEVRGAAVA